MDYNYIKKNSFLHPQYYMYSEYGGQNFLNIFFKSRIDFLDNLLNLVENKNLIKFEDSYHLAFFVEKKFNIDLQQVLSSTLQRDINFSFKQNHNIIDYTQFNTNDFNKNIDTEIFLKIYLFELIHKNINREQTQINKLVQRFEVSKKIYHFYQADFRKGHGESEKLELYLNFCIILILECSNNFDFQYMSTISKLNDFIISLQDHKTFFSLNKSYLIFVIIVEFFLLNKLCRQKGILVDFK